MQWFGGSHLIPMRGTCTHRSFQAKTFSGFLVYADLELRFLTKYENMKIIFSKRDVTGEIQIAKEMKW